MFTLENHSPNGGILLWDVTSGKKGKYKKRNIILMIILNVGGLFL